VRRCVCDLETARMRRPRPALGHGLLIPLNCLQRCRTGYLISDYRLRDKKCILTGN